MKELLSKTLEVVYVLFAITAAISWIIGSTYWVFWIDREWYYNLMLYPAYFSILIGGLLQVVNDR